MDQVPVLLKPWELEDFRDSLLVGPGCTQPMADYLVNSDTFTLDEILVEAYGR